MKIYGGLVFGPFFPKETSCIKVKLQNIKPYIVKTYNIIVIDK